MSKDVVFSYKTNGGSSPENKPKVYLTCHPADFDKFNDSICKDLFDFSDCAVFYTEDMEADLNNENSLIDLERMNLFVIPVTYRLLTEPNRTMDFDLKFAKEKHIPVLPLMMEQDLYDYYKDPDKFGELQYLKPNDHDLTSVNYRDKLSNYLNSVLISDELIDKIRAEFDAYIFLSYRKKDRKLANDLMRMIHDNPECEDVAIWFDEFLTPGKSFKNKIHESMQDSKLIAMLVTPRILEHYSNGSPNFIMSDEYPEAKRLNKPILPIEMEPTDKERLNQSFPGLPDCADTNDTDSFNKRLLEALSGIYNHSNNDDPEHNYLIGLAYLEGIDVEKDIDRAVKLLTKAAESGCADAIFQLYEMYRDGKGVKVDLHKSVYWSELLADHYLKNTNEDKSETRNALNLLAGSYFQIGDYQKSLELSQKNYSFCCDTWKENYKEAISALLLISLNYIALGDAKKALKHSAKCYSLSSKTWGEEREETLEALSSLAYSYVIIGNYQKAIELAQKGLASARKNFGNDYPLTIQFSGLLLSLQSNEQDSKQLQETYENFIRKHGKNHPQTVTALLSLINHFYANEEYETVAKMAPEAYSLACDIWGEDHPTTTKILYLIVKSNFVLGNKSIYLELLEKCYMSAKKQFGERDFITLDAMQMYAVTLGESGDYQRAIFYIRNCYALSKSMKGIDDLDILYLIGYRAHLHKKAGEHVLSMGCYQDYYKQLNRLCGSDNPDTLKAFKYYKESVDVVFNNACELYNKADYSNACNSFHKCYVNYKDIYGPNSEKALKTMDWLASAYLMTNQKPKALELFLKIYNFRVTTQGKEYPDLIRILNNIAITYYRLSEYQLAYSKQSECCSLSTKLYGENHDTTKKHLKFLEQIQKALSNSQENES